MKAFALLMLSGITLLGAAACTSKKTVTTGDRPMITGTVMYRARLALPSDAVLTVRLLDVTRPDAPPAVLADKSLSAPGNPPIAFELPYAAGAIRAGQKIVLEARIEVAGKPRFYSMAPHLVTPETLAQPHEVWVELVK